MRVSVPYRPLPRTPGCLCGAVGGSSGTQLVTGACAALHDDVGVVDGQIFSLCQSTKYTMQAQHVVLIDQDNVRAASGWPVAHAFRERVVVWAKSATAGGPAAVIIEVDEKHRHQRGSSQQHAERKAQRTHAIGEHVVANFLGSMWRADDGIVRDVEWWLRRPEVTSVLVISSDKQVRRRCSEVKQRLGNDGAVVPTRLRFDTSEAFGLMLPSLPAAAAPAAPAPAMVAPPSGALGEFVRWIEEDKPGPTLTASDVVHAGERSRLQKIGKPKRKLGVKR